MFSIHGGPPGNGLGRGLQFLLAAASLSVVAAVAPAHAGLITVTGEFTRFQGPVAYPPGSPQDLGFGPTFINGEKVEPDMPSSRPGFGLLDMAFQQPVSSVDFYAEPDFNPNLISFTPAGSQDVSIGQEFLIGTFTLQNGSWAGGLGEGDSLFSFTATTSSSDPLLDGKTFSDVIRFVITQGAAGNTPEQNADYFSFDGHENLGTMRVYEAFDSPTGSNIGSVDLYGRIGSLVPTRLDGAEGGAFIGPPREGEISVSPTYSLLFAGMGLLGLGRRGRKRLAH